MTWVKLTDQTARTVALREAGRDAALLWYTAITECAAANDGAGNDGLMTPLLVKDTAHLFELNAKRTTARLVEVGQWHDHVTVQQCGPCIDNGGDRTRPGDFFIHEWWKLLLEAAGKTDPIARKREQRRKALNNDKVLVAQVRERDRDLCRYCGVQTVDSSGAAKRNAKARTLDHRDPWGDNTLANVVVACRTCNGRKKDRTPEDAGMVLLPPGTTAIRPPARSRPDSAGSHPAEDPAATHVDPAEDSAVPRVTRETGRGRIGAGSLPGSGLILPERDRPGALACSEIESTSLNGAA